MTAAGSIPPLAIYTAPEAPMPAKRPGGVRDGAGRPPILTALQRLMIGAGIDTRLRRKTRADFKRSIAAKYADDEIARLRHELRTMPVHRRHAGVQALADVEIEIEEGALQGRRAFSWPAKTASGIREPIIRGVVRAASRGWGVVVTPRMAEKCLEEYRATRAKIDVDLAGYVEEINAYADVDVTDPVTAVNHL